MPELMNHDEFRTALENAALLVSELLEARGQQRGDRGWDMDVGGPGLLHQRDHLFDETSQRFQ